MSASLYTTAASIRALKAEALSIHNAKTQKYHLRAGRQYLFWDGSKLTDNREWAWVGTVEQARNCRRRFDAAAGCKISAIARLPQHEPMEG